MARNTFLIQDAPNGPLRGDVYLPATSLGAGVVLGLHGFKGFKDWGFWPETGRRLADAGFVCVTFNVSGSGIGENLEQFTEIDAFQANTIGKELQDLGRILDAVTHREIDTGGADIRRLGLLGHSRGGGVGLVRASRDPRVRSLVTWAAVSHFERFDAAQKEEWRARGYVEIPNQRTGQVLKLGLAHLEDLERHGDAYSPIEAARRLRIPYLIIHGTGDESVPPDEGDRLARAADPGLRQTFLIEGAGHTFGAAHPFTGPTLELAAVWARTVEWFQQTLQPA